MDAAATEYMVATAGGGEQHLGLVISIILVLCVCAFFEYQVRKRFKK